MVNPSSSRLQAIQTAREVLKNAPVYLDTETTGLGSTDEIVEISVVDTYGIVLVNTFVKPSRTIPAEAINIHGITDEMVQKAPAWPILWSQVRSFLVGKVVVAYNSDFDMRMMKQSHDRYRIPWKENLQPFDLLKLYAQFHGEWDSNRRSWKYFSLDKAGKASGISLPNSHRSLADTFLARALLIYIAGFNT
jgi:DNA polymerase-3 subunit epsilon